MVLQSHYRAGDQELLRQMNLAVILNHLRQKAPVSRATLAKMTGLNRATITRLVRDLIDHKFVREVGLKSSSTGRPSILLELNPDAGHIISAQIAANYVSVVCSKLVPGIFWRHREPVRPDMGQQAILDWLVELLREAEQAGQSAMGNLLGVAVGVPGIVDQATGTALFAHNLGWKNVPLQMLVQEVFDKPALIENDMNMAVMGEYYFGAAQEHDQVLYISAGLGLGGGMIYRGQLFRGAIGYASEFGHMVIDPDGEPCSCGARGCWETLASERALFRNLRRDLSHGHRGPLYDLTQGDFDGLTVQKVVDAADQGDDTALKALQDMGRHLASGIASLVNALDPELVVLGDMFSIAGHILLPIVQAELQQRASQLNRPATLVVVGQNQTDACLLGGVALVSQAILAQADTLMSRGPLQPA